MFLCFVLIVGDAGYALKPYLMTPFRATGPESAERRFNTKHAKARNIIERTIGVLKNRFRCLLGARQLHYSPKKAAQIVNICCALHNLCISHNIEFEIRELNADDDRLEYIEEDEGSDGAQRVRARVMNSIC